MIPSEVKIKNRTLPEEPGIYLMKGVRGNLLYVGKAGNLKRRVTSYFARPQEARIQEMVHQVRRIDYITTRTAIEALILEAEYIKKFSPPFNVKEKDDKSFLYVEITKEDFPRVRLVRGKDRAEDGVRFGPFTSASSIREALTIIRKIFPFNSHASEEIGKLARPCFDYQLGLCPGTCVGLVTKKTYASTVRNIKLFFGGKRDQVVKNMNKAMQVASKNLEFEIADKLKRQIFSLEHVQDVAFIKEDEIASIAGDPGGMRIEGYDISNISGASAVGSMVVFINGKPAKAEYRKFKIRGIEGPNDTGMLREVIIRRLGHQEWPLPVCMLIDGGLPQANAVHRVLRERGVRIPVVGIAKGPERKRNDFIGAIPHGIPKEVLIRVRDEAHRFAVKYHKEVRRVTFMK